MTEKKIKSVRVKSDCKVGIGEREIDVQATD